MANLALTPLTLRSLLTRGLGMEDLMVYIFHETMGKFVMRSDYKSSNHTDQKKEIGALNYSR